MMYNNYLNPVKSMKEMQEDARKKNNEEADRLCKNCCLCVGWSGIFIFICYVIIFVIMTFISSLLGKGNKEDEQLLIIEGYLGSGSN